MRACTFFGHHMISENIKPKLLSVITELIEKNDVHLFYVGNHGSFDSAVFQVLKQLAQTHDIKYYVILAYMPDHRGDHHFYPNIETLLPNGIEAVPKRYAILYRNKWMVNNSDFVVTYVRHDQGSGAARFKRLAERKNKVVIELSEV